MVPWLTINSLELTLCKTEKHMAGRKCKMAANTEAECANELARDFARSWIQAKIYGRYHESCKYP